MALIIGWMVLQLFVGMYLGWAFFGEKIRWQNMAYYIFLAGSLLVLLWSIYRLWKGTYIQKNEINNNDKPPIQ